MSETTQAPKRKPQLSREAMYFFINDTATTENWPSKNLRGCVGCDQPPHPSRGCTRIEMAQLANQLWNYGDHDAYPNSIDTQRYEDEDNRQSGTRRDLLIAGHSLSLA